MRFLRTAPLIVLLAALPLLQSCAGPGGAAKDKGFLRDDQVEIIKETYQIEQAKEGDQGLVVYEGTIKNWRSAPAYEIKADFIFYDAKGAPVFTSKERIIPKLNPGEARDFVFKRYVSGKDLHRVSHVVWYSENKPSLFGAGGQA